MKEKGKLNVKGESSDCELLYRFPRSRKPLGVTNLKSVEKYLHSSLHSFVSLHLQKRSCYDTNFKAKKVYSHF